MTPPEATAAVRRDLAEAARLAAALADLDGVDRAREEYEAFRADLSARRAELERAARPVPQAAAAPAAPPTPGPGPTVLPPPPGRPRSSAPPPAAPPPTAPPAAAADPVRDGVKRLAGRMRHVWGISDDVLARLNRVAGDPGRLPGEAVALLPPAAFEAARPEQLAGWAAALRAYVAHLAEQVAFAESRAGTWLGVWRLWRDRDTPAGRAAWDACLAGGRRELADRVADLERRLAGGGR